jgi:hypothetical protein
VTPSICTNALAWPSHVIWILSPAQATFTKGFSQQRMMKRRAAQLRRVCAHVAARPAAPSPWAPRGTRLCGAEAAGGARERRISGRLLSLAAAAAALRALEVRGCRPLVAREPAVGGQALAARDASAAIRKRMQAAHLSDWRCAAPWRSVRATIGTDPQSRAPAPRSTARQRAARARAARGGRVQRRTPLATSEP